MEDREIFCENLCTKIIPCPKKKKQQKTKCIFIFVKILATLLQIVYIIES